MGMSEVADMKMDNIRSGKSRFTELYQMEASFYTMSRKLKVFWEDELLRAKELQDEKERMNRMQIRTAEEGALKMGHPMVLCQASYFVTMPGLLPYENLRDEGKLVILDTEEELRAFKMLHMIVFLSHQWLSYKHPDPSHIHHRTMIEAIKQLQKKLKYL